MNEPISQFQKGPPTERTGQAISQQRGEISISYFFHLLLTSRKRRSRRRGRVGSSTTLNCWPVLHDPSNSHPASRIVVVVPIHRIIPVAFRIIETMSCSVSNFFSFFLVLSFLYSLLIFIFLLASHSIFPILNVFTPPAGVAIDPLYFNKVKIKIKIKITEAELPLAAKALFSLPMSQNDRKEIITHSYQCVSDSVKHE
ncbi:hypothetical protein HOY80DRAFT_44433 [Tuber brumale]|nr:hypothetical protein HOY80DRAFT_44433 [Tuber brumale]